MYMPSITSSKEYDELLKKLEKQMQDFLNKYEITSFKDAPVEIKIRILKDNLQNYINYYKENYEECMNPYTIEIMIKDIEDLKEEV